MHITNHAIEGLAGDGVVATGSELGSQAVTKDELASNLGSNGDAQGHPGQLKSPSNDVEVPNREKQGDDGSIGDAGGTCNKRLSVTRREWNAAYLGRSFLDLRGFCHDKSSEKKEW